MGGICSVDGCAEDAARSIRVTATYSSPLDQNGFRRMGLLEVPIEVGVCAGHHRLLTANVLRDLSIG